MMFGNLSDSIIRRNNYADCHAVFLAGWFAGWAVGWTQAGWFANFL
jgi:hypothetical protein